MEAAGAMKTCRTDEAVSRSCPADVDEKKKLFRKKHHGKPGKLKASPKCNDKHANRQG